MQLLLLHAPEIILLPLHVRCCATAPHFTTLRGVLLADNKLSKVVFDRRVAVKQIELKQSLRAQELQFLHDLVLWLLLQQLFEAFSLRWVLLRLNAVDPKVIGALLLFNRLGHLDHDNPLLHLSFESFTHLQVATGTSTSGAY